MRSTIAWRAACILQEQREARPSLQDVVERLGQIVPARQFGELVPTFLGS